MYAPEALAARSPLFADTPEVVWAHQKIAANVALYLSHTPNSPNPASNGIAADAWVYGVLAWAILITGTAGVFVVLFLLLKTRTRRKTASTYDDRGFGVRSGYGSI